jgi:RNA polymerase sigma-70 factor (ECF subfamily)
VVSDTSLERALRGDEEAFGQLVSPHRRELHFHCYRMLGSMDDAEDALQETMLAAWRGLSSFEQRASLRAWLYRIATNRCLNALRDASRRPPSMPEPPFETPPPTRIADPSWLEPYPDALLDSIRDAAPEPDARYETREAIEIAFIAALQQLPPRQRASLILRDVLGFHTDEVAGILDSSEDSVKSALKRARSTLDRQLPDRHRTPAPAPDSAAERDLVKRFTDAFLEDDVDAMIALLTQDAWLTMPPSNLQYQGPPSIGAFLAGLATWRAGQRSQIIPTRANTQPAFGCYRDDPHAPISHGSGIVVLTLAGDEISAITWFLGPKQMATFGLPRTLPS